MGQVGFVYTAQAFEFHCVGVIIGLDMVFDSQGRYSIRSSMLFIVLGLTPSMTLSS
ncbi:MAG: DUF2075 domain-containing protein [Pseudobacteriovorax sp.]|nr:DUF2075 domain-containing protein [Pseudobacteriovorax sp.]